MNQNDLVSKFNIENRPRFNPTFFERNEDDIIEELRKVILSSQRDKFFTIKVEGFRVIKDYAEVQETLYRYEENCSKNRRSRDNVYSYINIKDSDVILLEVSYFISIKDQSDHIKVLIEVPRIVEKYYFRIAGNIYSALYQIVDASTYNNATSTSKKHVVILKTMFMPVKIYRSYKTLKSCGKETVKCTFYETRAFNKTVSVIKYIMAKFGFYGTLQFLGIEHLSVTSKPIELEDNSFYSFMKNDIYINIPKFIFDNNAVAQSAVYTIYKSIIKDTTFNDIYTSHFWQRSLGMEFNNVSAEKGLAVLDSLENVYDMATKEVIHLPEDQKADIFCILRWMISEFSNLRKKDNTELTTKRIRYAEYIASLYAMKLSQAIYRVSDLGNRAELKSIKRSIDIHPGYLLTQITKCKLVNYRNMVNDLDSIGILKFTYKGISGIGEKGSSAVPTQFKAVNVSHLGRVDLDSSSASDPGMSGALCPLQELHGSSKSFSDFEEPNAWQDELNRTMAAFRALTGKKEAFILMENALGETHTEEINRVEDGIQVVKRVINPFIHMEEYYEGFPLEGSGSIQLIAEDEGLA